MKSKEKKGLTSLLALSSFLVLLIFFDLPPSPAGWESPRRALLTQKDISPGAGQVLRNQSRIKLLKEICRALQEPLKVRLSPLTAYQNRLKKTLCLPAQRHSGNWSSLEQTLLSRGQKSFYLLGFGSLLDPAFSQEFASREGLAVAFGVKRFFGFNPQRPETSPLGLPEAPNHHEVLRLTTRLTQNPQDMTNGVLLKINLGKEMEALRTREAGYDLVKVPILKLSQNLSQNHPIEALDEAYILVEPPHPHKQERDLLPLLAPHIAYLYICLRGAKTPLENTSEDLSFLKLFIETTYLSDAKTPISYWVHHEIEHLLG